MVQGDNVARIKGGMIRFGKPGKKRKKGVKLKRRDNVAYRKAENTGEPLRAARLLAGY